MFRLIISGIGFLLIITFSVVICEDLLLQTVASSSLKPSTSTTELSPFSLSANTCLECETSVQKALAWLVSQREPDYGWRNDTPKVITTLQLIQSNDDLKGLLPSSVEMQLSSKQMEVEIVVLLWRHHEIPVTPPKLAQYSLALSALCEDPRQFHGHDLIGTLQHHESTHDLDFAYASLAVCSAKAHLRKKQIRRLLDIASNAKDHNIDTLAMTILALRCIVRDHRHRNLQHSLKRPGMSLARQQLPDGSFGNLYNTALTILALQDAPEANNYWNKSAAIGYIESKQDPDGAFTDPGLTAEVILALSSKGLSAIRGFDCGKIDQEDENHGCPNFDVRIGSLGNYKGAATLPGSAPIRSAQKVFRWNAPCVFKCTRLHCSAPRRIDRPTGRIDHRQGIHPYIRTSIGCYRIPSWIFVAHGDLRPLKDCFVTGVF